MVAPLLALGILGAGYAGKGYLDQFASERSEKRRGQRFQDALAPVSGADPMTQMQALASAGILSPETYADASFQDQQGLLGFQRDSMLQEDRQAHDFGMAQQGQAWARENLGFEQQQSARAAMANAQAGVVQEFQPQIDQVNTQLGKLSDMNNLLGDINNLGITERQGFWGTEEGKIARAQLVEMEEEQFFDWKKKVYGDAEPPAEVLTQLRESFYQATGGSVAGFIGEGRIERAMEVNDRRAQGYRRDATRLADDYTRRLDSLQYNELMLPQQVMQSGRNYDPTRLLQSESGGRFDVGVNSEGYGGRAQMGSARLEDAARAGVVPAGTTGADYARFSDEQQQEVEQWHFSELVDRAQTKFGDAIGSEVGGVPITLEGMVNAMHLSGEGGLAAFLRSGGRENRKDSNGTSVADYLAMGAGWNG